MAAMHDFAESIGQGTNIGALSHIGSNVTIGRDCRIQGSVYIADGCLIGNEVFIGPNATLTNDRHPPSGGNWAPVIVQDNVVIGANATIVAGVILNAELHNWSGFCCNNRHTSKMRYGLATLLDF